MPAIGANQRRVPGPPALPAVALTGSGVENEGALQRVLAAQLEVVAERRMLRAVDRRLANEDRRAGHRREDRVAEHRRRAVRPLIGFEFGMADIADGQRAAALMH